MPKRTPGGKWDDNPNGAAVAVAITRPVRRRVRSLQREEAHKQFASISAPRDLQETLRLA
jgi:hypothetical protein